MAPGALGKHHVLYFNFLLLKLLDIGRANVWDQCLELFALLKEDLGGGVAGPEGPEGHQKVTILGFLVRKRPSQAKIELFSPPNDPK